MLDFIEEKRGKKAREEVKVLEEKDNERRQALVKLKPTPLFFPITYNMAVLITSPVNREQSGSFIQDRKICFSMLGFFTLFVLPE